MTAPHQIDADDAPEMLDADDAHEVIEEYDEDELMDSGDEELADEEAVETTLRNDSVAAFDAFGGGVFAIAQHPTKPNLIATGGSEGSADDMPGKGYVLRIDAPPTKNRKPEVLFEIAQHSDSIVALAFTLPHGEFLVSGGMEGRVAVHKCSENAQGGVSFAFHSDAKEAEEGADVNWIAPCPVPANSQIEPNTIAFGLQDGSVWIATIDPEAEVQLARPYTLRQQSCNAGAWSPDGKFLATIYDDGSLDVWDVWGEAAAQGLTNKNGQTVVSLDSSDKRFAVEGGLISVAIDPKSTFVAVGGDHGAIKIVSLPRLAAGSGGSRAGGSQGGKILADLRTQSDSIESLSFSPTKPLLAASSLDGSICVYDTSRSFTPKRHITEAHETFSIPKVEFISGFGDGWLLTSCGTDGVVRRWNFHGAADTPTGSMVKEWRGHSVQKDGVGGVLGFVQSSTGQQIVTAGDDNHVYVFET
ncbi:putative ribosome biogenesis protein sqt1 protein [Rosellinia necatrix]|uniref:Putative ribosome biogenesis protein sqt1 protein n=1 Tax=Rosellinia necatrix TaxID=77044 RepID=A0A1W2TGI9_ROSNE|nr:putative ribosome biogenesis protein sqt1 protein [Rosellinia necatrix]